MNKKNVFKYIAALIVCFLLGGLLLRALGRHPDFRRKQSYYTDRAFISVTVRLLCITANSLRFTTPGGKYPWQDFHLQELCHARHTIKENR